MVDAGVDRVQVTPDREVDPARVVRVARRHAEVLQRRVPPDDHPALGVGVHQVQVAHDDDVPVGHGAERVGHAVVSRPAPAGAPRCAPSRPSTERDHRRQDQRECDDRPHGDIVRQRRVSGPHPERVIAKLDVDVKNRFGIYAEHPHYKWWALSCTSLGHAAGDHQLGHADHRPARPRARAPHDAARPRVGDPRLHDRLDRARAHRGPAVRPVRPQAGLRRRLRRLRAHLARRRLRRERHRADPVADPPGRRRRVPVRQRRRARHRRVPARAARPRDGHQHDDRRGRARARAGARRRARLDLVALGVLVQRAVRARSAPPGATACSTSSPGATPTAGSTCSAPRRSWPASPGSCSASPRAASRAGTTRS